MKNIQNDNSSCSGKGHWENICFDQPVLGSPKQGIPSTLVDCDAEEPNDAEFIPVMCWTRKMLFKIPVIDDQKCTFAAGASIIVTTMPLFICPDKRFIKVVEELCHDCMPVQLHAHRGTSLKEKAQVHKMYVGIPSVLVEARTEIGVYSPVPVIKKRLSMPAMMSFYSRCLRVFRVRSLQRLIKPTMWTVTEPTPFAERPETFSRHARRNRKPYGVVSTGQVLETAMSICGWKKNILVTEILDKEIAMVYSEGSWLLNWIQNTRQYAALQSVKKNLNDERNCGVERQRGTGKTMLSASLQRLKRIWLFDCDVDAAICTSSFNPKWNWRGLCVGGTARKLITVNVPIALFVQTIAVSKPFQPWMARS